MVPVLRTQMTVRNHWDFTENTCMYQAISVTIVSTKCAPKTLTKRVSHVPKGQQIIALNGQQYDAQTGKRLAPTKAPTQGTKGASAKRARREPSKGTQLDGVTTVKRSRTIAATANTIATRVRATPQHSKTLMRHVVKKPNVIKTEKRAAPAPANPTQAASKSTQAFPGIVKPQHVIHASGVQRSALISKFGRNNSNQIKTDIIPVKSAPTHGRKVAARPQAAPHQVVVGAVSAPVQPIEATDDLTLRGLAAATSHTQPKLKKQNAFRRAAKRLHVSPLTLTGGIAALLLLVGGGWYAYQNVPGIAMQVAVRRSGIHANLPTYSPAGYSLHQPISYAPGQINLEYKSNSDNRSFSVVQRASSWNSQALLDNYINAAHKQYQTMQVNGRTIYTYDSGNATWVDGGTWYQINGDSTLSSEQLLKIVDSL